jgi:hypothetical protein
MCLAVTQEADRMNVSPPQSRKGAVMAVVLLALAALLQDAASASSRVCRQLEAELAGGGRTAAQSRKNDAAIAKQRAQLQAAKRQARASGCGFRLFGSASSSCSGINAKIDGLERRVASLQRKQPAGASGRSRAQTMAALRANGCRAGQTASTKGPRNLLEKLFGGGIGQREIIEDAGPPQKRDTRQPRRAPAETTTAGGIRFSAPPGRYRTLCVRSCDGYYFPLATSSRPSDFARDHANCQTSCPGTEAQLYYTQPDGEAETMVSGISGQAYTDLPSAWLYKQVGVSAPAGCTCTAQKSNAAVGLAASSGDHTSALPEQTGTAAPAPPGQPEPEAGAGSEVKTDRDGRRDADAVHPTEEKSGAGQEALGKRRVRVVGPVFLPDREGAEDPQAPGRNEVR